MKAWMAMAATMLAAGTASAQRPPVQHYPVSDAAAAAVRAPGSTPPFSAAVRAGDVLYLSGSIGSLPDGSLPQGIEAQTRQVMENIRAVLTDAGASFDDVVRCLVMLDDMADWPAFNRVYVTYFNAARRPARSAFGADGLARGALVEVECTAYVPERR
ncbi:RidA family protein [Sphingosinicella sp. LHD-64]|uniref:RidA family protein n=1 Tax=Sphingosinicella sp. LHD-64 TaxID=3072139 RepID=UPI00280FB4B3|nr:RidA family protein [Sphingosinicella sp. LHD-64]MDQ8754698.1 RidA family protein [Sphingosinicella sp. LHD-64]